ncbi:MAG: aldose 1-epimerase, partial [Henriciella sp.]|uniref:aldose 1-epimerase n=1 Tax=Henriciella sp. TaxID=1968823 RepID=UPI003C72BBC2
MSDTALPGSTRNATSDLRQLRGHGFELELQAGCGGRIVSLRHQGKDVLHPDTRPRDRNVLDAGCFPLVPFSNRIRNGEFSFGGKAYSLDSNWDGDAHAIHGEGWTSAWTVTHQDDVSARLWMSGSGWWPWAYECSQMIRLAPNKVILSLNVTNLDNRPMPAGLGFHPYFPHHPGTQLQFSATGVIAPMGERLAEIDPLTPKTDFSQLTDVDARDLDHGYAGWDGTATIHQPGQAMEIAVRTSCAPAGTVVYTPPDLPFFCFEPVS